MKIKDTVGMTRAGLTASLACVGFCVAMPLLAAQEQQTAVAPTQAARVAAVGKPARQCMSDLRVFDASLKHLVMDPHGRDMTSVR